MSGHRWPWRSDSRWLRRLTIASTALVAVICLAETWSSDRWWLTAPLTWAPQLQWAAFPALLVLWSLLAGNLRWAAVNLAATAFIVLGPAGLETGNARVSAGDTIVVATHNLAGRVGMTPKLRDHWLDDCDVLCIQEGAADGFARMLTKEDGYDQAEVGDVRTFIRGRIARTEVIGPARGSHRRFLACQAEIDGRRVAILNVHLATNLKDRGLSRRLFHVRRYLRGAVAVRVREHRLIEEWLAGQAHPALVLGDFNTPPSSAHHRRLAASATDAFEATGRGFGYTYLVRGVIPAVRIDYVWCANGATPVSCTTGGEWASDHMWVEARVELPDSSEDEE